jgi:tRNA 2-thiouridine synthesizing protein A
VRLHQDLPGETIVGCVGGVVGHPWPIQEMFDDETPAYEDEWDTGDLECGELLLPLRGRVEALRAGAVIRLITRNASAVIDLRAWCRVTGHRMVKMNPPDFFIQRKED